MTEPIRVLIVDDEEDILEFVDYNLTQENYITKTVKSGAEALHALQNFPADLIIIDIMMPDMDGIELCTIIREKQEFKNTLIAFLTARNESYTHVSALESGGDDFINKPIKPSILKSRIKALLRRHVKFQNEEINNNYHFGSLEINPEKMLVKINGIEVALAKKEFELLKLLISKPGKVFKRLEILNDVWGNEIIVGDRTIDVHVRKLREKIGSKYIVTYKGIGYKFDF